MALDHSQACHARRGPVLLLLVERMRKQSAQPVRQHRCSEVVFSTLCPFRYRIPLLFEEIGRYLGPIVDDDHRQVRVEAGVGICRIGQ